MAAYADLRQWLDRLEEEGELARIKATVDWNLEIGAIAQEIFDREGPALLFENIKDYENGHCSRLFTASLSTYRRVALLMAMNKDTHPKQLIKEYMDRITQPLKPVVVETGPVKEIKEVGDQVDLYEFPAPIWHKLDGARYIGTFHGVVTKDPETGWVNVGLYRMAIHDKNHTGITVIPGQHNWRHFRKYKAMGKPMPLAVVIGWDPVLPMIACSSQPPEVCEYDIMGAIRRSPVELVKCETVDLEVPASAEIVLEGEVTTNLDDFKVEGPFGEYTGYYCSAAGLKPVVTINCVTHRKNPILQGTMEGVPINEDHRVGSINHSALVWAHLNRHMTGVTAVNVHPSTGWPNVFVQIDNSYVGQAHQVAALIWGLGISNQVGKNIMVVDQDIDVYDLNKLNWAFAYRVDPKKDLHMFEGWGSPTDPIVHPDDRVAPVLNKVTRLLIDATKPIENKRHPTWFNEKFAPVCYTDGDTLAAMKRRWPEYGIKL